MSKAAFQISPGPDRVDLDETKRRVHFFNANIDPLTMGESLQFIEKIVDGRKPTHVAGINVAKIVMMQKDHELRKIVNSCGLIHADGQGIVWGSRLLGHKIPERVPGIDLFLNAVRLAEKKRYRLYFLGAKEAVVRKVVNIFTSDYPNLQVAGYHNGYFTKEEEQAVARDIRESRADMLFVGMSSPKKEFFIDNHLDFMQVPFVMGVGGSFDSVAGSTLRAPAWMQEAGLEWFFRLLNEPRRMWKRYFVSNSIFLGMLLKALISGRKK